MKDTKIEWATHTFNPWTGCTKISTAAGGGGGCDNCYAEAWSKRAGAKVGKWGHGAPRVRTTAANWRQPLKWNDEALLAKERPRVFCASLADVFDNEVPDEWRADLFDLIRRTPNLTWLLLTKRIGNAETMIDDAAEVPDGTPRSHWEWPWPNVWIGATVVNQAEADRDISKLLAVPAAKRFLSIEPMLGPIDLRKWLGGWDVVRQFGSHGPVISRKRHGIDWVICGSESGHGARACDVAWVRSLQAQCFAAGVPFFWKQHVVNGKKLSLPELDGKSWAELPT